METISTVDYGSPLKYSTDMLALDFSKQLQQLSRLTVDQQRNKQSDTELIFALRDKCACHFMHSIASRKRSQDEYTAISSVDGSQNFFHKVNNLNQAEGILLPSTASKSTSRTPLPNKYAALPRQSIHRVSVRTQQPLAAARVRCMEQDPSKALLTHGV